jgi:hypothetical protein
MDEPERQRILDQEHLRLLRIGYFFQGGVTLLMCVFGLFYVFLGLFAFSSLKNMPSNPGGPPPEFVGYVMAAMGGLFTVGGAIFGILQFFTARFLRLRRQRAVCLVTAAVCCVFIPYGTVLGVCTFLVLGRPAVRALFSGTAAEPNLPA